MHYFIAKYETYQQTFIHDADRYLMRYPSHHSPVHQIFDEISICIIHLPVRYSILNHPSACQIFDEMSICTTHLPARYSILHHLPACQIFDPESPACLPDIRFWITCLSVRYSVRYSSLSFICLHHESMFVDMLHAFAAKYMHLITEIDRSNWNNALRFQCFFASKCTENTVLFCLENLSFLHRISVISSDNI